MFELRVIQNGDTVSSHRLGAEPLYVGRGIGNDVALINPTISSRHMVVWVADDGAWVEDLGSRNGTSVNGEKIRGRKQVKEGDQITLADVTLSIVRVRGRALHGPFEIEDCATGIRYPLYRDRFSIGSGDESDLTVPDAGRFAAIVVQHHDGTLELGLDDELRPLGVGHQFKVGSRLFAVRIARRAAATVEREMVGYPYRVTYGYDATAGALVSVSDLRTGNTHRLTTENRSVVLYVLAKQLDDDRLAGKGVDDRGWVAEADVATALWGKSKAGRSVNVVVYRARQELRTAGFDPWFIEKTRGRLRLRADEVVKAD